MDEPLASNRTTSRRAPCKTAPMAANLRDVTRDFARGQVALETWRAAARAERADRQLADAVLMLINEWESKAMAQSVRARNELRARAKQLLPPEPVTPPASTYRRDPSESIYAAGLRGQKRRT
jgi:hypothetical protein